MKSHKIPTHSTHSDNCNFHFFYWLSDWVEILWGCTTFYSNRLWKFQLFILKIKKVLFQKKKFKPLSISKQKSFDYWPDFQWRFCIYPSYWEYIIEIARPRTSFDHEWKIYSRKHNLSIIELFALFFRGNDVIFDLSENLLIIRHNKGSSKKYVGIGHSNYMQSYIYQVL